VDNGSTDPTPAVLREFRAQTSINLQAILEPRPGVSRARNTGWRSACGEVIAFTDDDCYPQSDFVDQVWRAFSEAEVGYVGGRVLLYDPADYPITIQTRDSHLAIPASSFIEAGLIHGANVAVRRDVLRMVGGFDELLGPGMPIPAGEDVDFISRLSIAGIAGAYDPGPTVFHHHRRRTESQVAALRRSYDLGRGAYYIKCILDPARRWLGIKHWVRSIKWRLAESVRRPHCTLSVIREIQGAFQYVCAAALGMCDRTSKSLSHPRSRGE